MLLLDMFCMLRVIGSPTWDLNSRGGGSWGMLAAGMRLQDVSMYGAELSEPWLRVLDARASGLLL